MMNPIFPQASGASADPALEGRVESLETDVLDLKNVDADLVRRDLAGFYSPVSFIAYGADYLSAATPLSSLGVAPGWYPYKINGVDVGMNVFEGQTVDDVVSNIFPNAMTNQANVMAFVFGIGIKILVENGSTIQFPRSGLWDNLGFGGVNLSSVGIDKPYYVDGASVYLSSNFDNISDAFLKMRDDIGMLNDTVQYLAYEIEQMKAAANV